MRLCVRVARSFVGRDDELGLKKNVFYPLENMKSFLLYVLMLTLVAVCGGGGGGVGVVVIVFSQ